MLKNNVGSSVKGAEYLQLPLRPWTLKAISISAMPSVYITKANMNESPPARIQNTSKNDIL